MQTAVDLFGGPGGWDSRALRLGIESEGIEIDDAACATREAVGLLTRQDDVSQVDPLEYLGVDGLIASPPCPDWSRAGKKLGFAGTSGHLVEEVMRWASALRPRWIACEQVPTVLPIWQMYAELLEADGYHTWVGNMYAEQFGVPQARTRAILLARLDRPVAPPAPTHSRFYGHNPGQLDMGVPCWRSMSDALGWGMTHRPYPVLAGARKSGGPDKEKVGGSGARATLYGELAAGRWKFRDQPVKHDGPFLPSEDGRDGVIRLDIPEAGVLQTFPVNYPWQGNRTKQFQQITNAVPPMMAEAILTAVTADITLEEAA